MPSVISTGADCFLKRATDLFNQQVWCWGRDIVRPEGNWLIEIGFERITPPTDHIECPSIYKLNLGRGRTILLRGFGVFYGDEAYGGVFLPRYTFKPRFTTEPNLSAPIWMKMDLPDMGSPAPSQQDACTRLVLDLLDWISHYETELNDRLGVEYRDETLEIWKKKGQEYIPAESIVSAWRELSLHIAGSGEV